MTAVDASGCVFLDWDTAFFGIRVGQLNAARLTAESLHDASQWCRRHAIDCLYVLTQSGDPDERALADSAGLRHVDVRVTARKVLADLTDDLDPRLRPASPRDIPRLREIAAQSHRETRFYADPRFPHARADEMYALWIEQSVKGRADHVLVAEHDGTVVGYMTGKREPSEGRLVLMSVDAAFRGAGFGRALTVDMMQWLRQYGYATAYLTTQDGDTPAMRLYKRLGFTFDRREHWYHWWPRVPR